MNKTEMKKYDHYRTFDDGLALSYELEHPEHVVDMNFNKADQAIKYLKAHSEDNIFEFESATPALLKAIEYLETFEGELKTKMIESIAEDERKQKLSKTAHSKASKIIDEKIKPQLEKLLSDIGELNNVENYSHAWFRYDFEQSIKQIKTALRV